MQLTFEGKTIDQLSIDLIRAYEPKEGYYLGFSGGKDSVVIYDLAVRSGVKFDAHYNVSPIDPPQIHQFIKEYYSKIQWDYHARGFFGKPFDKHGLPLRIQRWCCELIKEAGGKDRLKILGMRRAESNTRSKYKCYSENYHQLLPILNWSNTDVWQYIGEQSLAVCPLYSEGFTRIGCVLCPFTSKDEAKYQIAKFPKIATAWKAAAGRYIQARIERGNPTEFQTGEEYFNWWISRK
jgi:phosphoadenosine phosphosulfate reductase